MLAAGVAGVVPRRWERNRLLMDAIRPKLDPESREEEEEEKGGLMKSLSILLLAAAKGFVSSKQGWLSTSGWCRCWSGNRGGRDWSLGRGGSLVLTGPAPKRLRVCAAGRGAGDGDGARSGVGLPHCSEDT